MNEKIGLLASNYIGPIFFSQSSFSIEGQLPLLVTVIEKQKFPVQLMLTDRKKYYLAKLCFGGQMMNSKATQSDGNSIRPSSFLAGSVSPRESL